MMEFLLAVAFLLILILSLLLLRANIVRKLGILVAQLHSVEGRVGILEITAATQIEALERMLQRTIQPIHDRLSKQEAEISEVKDMLVQLVNERGQDGHFGEESSRSH